MSNEVPAFGSLHYWFRLKLPMTETIHLYEEKMKAVDYIHSTLSQDTQVAEQTFTLQHCYEVKSASRFLTPCLHCSSCPAAGGMSFTSPCKDAKI